MGKIKSQAHNMLLPVFLNNSANLGHHLDGSITNILFFIVEKIVEKRENCSTDALVTHLAEILRDQGNQWGELVQ